MISVYLHYLHSNANAQPQRNACLTLRPKYVLYFGGKRDFSCCRLINYCLYVDNLLARALNCQCAHAFSGAGPEFRISNFEEIRDVHRPSSFHAFGKTPRGLDRRCTSTPLCSRSRCGAREAMTVGCKPTIHQFNFDLHLTRRLRTLRARLQSS